MNTLQKELNVKISKDRFPLTFTFDPGTPTEDFISWYQANKPLIEEELLNKGAILFEGAAIDTVPRFEEVTGSIATKFRNYLDGSYPRRNLKGHVYISTEYDPAYDITMHNELSYSIKWPEKLFFGCIVAPAKGGATPLVDSREVYKKMNPELLKEFETKKVRYVRNLHGGDGMGPSWQQTFETDDQKVVEKHCKEIDIAYEWKDNGGLKLVNIRPATRQHPITKEWVWFNQADQYHPSHFPEEVYETLILLAEGEHEALPLYVSFGDGSPISEDIIKEIMKTIDEVTVVRPWQKGDFVVVDNMLVAHGRKAYEGDRQVVVSMA